MITACSTNSPLVLSTRACKSAAILARGSNTLLRARTRLATAVRVARHVADPAFQSLVEELPGCTIVLEHLAGAYRPLSPDSVTAPYDNYRAALTLSRFPNTYIKFGGLGEFCIRPRPLAAQFGFEEVPPLMEMAYEAFGPRRMMWGSDYPPVGGREGYRNSLQATMEHPVFKSQDDKDWAFGKAALAAFKME